MNSESEKNINNGQDRDTNRFDSRCVAKMLGIDHKNLIAMIGKYEKQIVDLGPMPAVETITIKTPGRPLRFFHLTEGQCYFLCILSKSTEKSLMVKWALVRYLENLRFGADGPQSTPVITAMLSDERIRDAPSPKRPMKTYLIKDGYTGLYKIGRAYSPGRRSDTITAYHPLGEVVAISPKNLETKMHNLFHAQRVRGEWFRLTDADVAFIVNQFKV